jgi:hypothetical protein
VGKGLAISDIGVYLDGTKGFKMGKCPEGMSSFIAGSEWVQSLCVQVSEWVLHYYIHSTPLHSLKNEEDREYREQWL